jgi:hypothetical protein
LLPTVTNRHGFAGCSVGVPGRGARSVPGGAAGDAVSGARYLLDAQLTGAVPAKGPQ